MISLPHNSPADHDGAALQERALRRRQRHTAPHRSQAARAAFSSLLRQNTSARRLPVRYALHLLIALVVPLAAFLSQFPLTQPAAPAPAAPAPAASSSDFIAPVAPLALEGTASSEQAVPNASFAEIDGLRVPAANAQLFAVQPVPATVTAERANVRNGPGTSYDMVAKLAAGVPLLVLARAGDWYKAQQQDDSIIWVAADLVSLNGTAADLLPEATDIPAPPPAKVGQVAEDSLNLRDGPDTSYVGMVKLALGAQLDLLARYGEWFQVQTAQGQTGWVLGQHLALQPGVAERVETVATIPDPNPALVGVVGESNVALRGGPGAAYDKINALGNGMQLDLLGRYQDWFKVRTSKGTVGWVSNELVDVNGYIGRRVPTLRDIPALPQPKPAVQKQQQPLPLVPRPTTKPIPVRPAPAVPAPEQPAPAVPAVPVPAVPEPAPAPEPAPPAPVASGDVVSFALQFRGARYAWGGASPKGFDCSGFVMYVYKQFGLSLPHSAAGQYNTRYGAIISNPAELQPGDIVFFANTYARGISHVGIYVGGGNVMQALSPKLGVGVANLGGGYWQAHYYSAIRPNR